MEPRNRIEEAAGARGSQTYDQTETRREAQAENSGTAEITLRVDIQEVRRHTDVVTESLRDDIRMIAEGVVSLATKVDTLRG